MKVFENGSCPPSSMIFKLYQTGFAKKRVPVDWMNIISQLAIGDLT
jgi:hypothetical protein